MPAASLPLLVAVVVAAGSLGAAAQQPLSPPADAKPAFDMTVMAIRYDGVPDNWDHSLPEVAPEFATVDELCPREIVTLLVFLHNVGADAKGEGRVTMSVREETPTGQPGLHQDDIPAWSGRAPAGANVFLSQANIGIGYDEAEPLGERTLSFVARDESSGAKVERKVDLTLHQWSEGDAPATAAEFATWMNEYHRAPKPAEAVHALLEFGEMQQGADWNYAVIGFFRTIFTDDPWLLDHLVATHNNSAAQRTRAAFLLRFLDKLDRLPELYPVGADSMRAMLAQLQLPDAYGELTTAAQLDLLWGEFLASGRYKPIRQIVHGLEAVDGEDPAAAYKASQQTDADRAKLIRALSAQTAVWSLTSNIEQHALVRQYAEWMLTNEKLSDKERGYLAGCLKLALEKAKAHDDEAPR